MAEFGKIVVFGTGLIGGSFSLALKEAEAVEEVVGFGVDAVHQDALVANVPNAGVQHRVGRLGHQWGH